jgi:GMP synthase (glutamine-hydrolysing)
MRALAIVHEDDTGPGVFIEAAIESGWKLEQWRIAAGERCPDDPFAYDAVVSCGGSMHAHVHDRHAWLVEEEALLGELTAAGRPVLGVCLGAQLLARATAGTTSEMEEPEIGWYPVRVSQAGQMDPLLRSVYPDFRALQWHSCEFRPGPGTVTLAESALCVQAFRVAGAPAWGIQFHAEVTLVDFESWLDQSATGDGPEDPDRLRAQTRAGISEWNALGRGLFMRFLDSSEPD